MFSLDLKEIDGALIADRKPPGVVRDMLFINGRFPGPKIEVNRGDRIIVNVTNQLSSNSTTMHWHGLFQNGTNYFDGTEGEQHRSYRLGPD